VSEPPVLQEKPIGKPTGPGLGEAIGEIVGPIQVTDELKKSEISLKL
jgi:hypothetical protein